MTRKLTYLEATEVKSLRKDEVPYNRVLIWLAKVNENLPYDVRLSGTEIEILADILSEQLASFFDEISLNRAGKPR